MTVRVRLLGGLEVDVDGVSVPPNVWARRQAAALVELLALARGRRMHREQVIEALWPGLSVEIAGPRLHKAAHYARRALGGAPHTVLLRNDAVTLLADTDVVIDVDEFRRLGEQALADADADRAATALALYRGPLLPDDLYEPWTEQARESLKVLHVDLLRLAGRYDSVLVEDPTDEHAHLEVIRGLTDSGDIRGAIRQFERLDQALRRELGTAPSPEAQHLRAALEQQVGVAPRATSERDRPVRLVGRRDVGDQIRERLGQAEQGHGSTLLISGPPGVGKSAVLDLAEALASRRGWRSGRGSASSVEGTWPYAPVLEALSDLCRTHPALLDGLDDIYRLELERALSGRDVTWSGESGHQRLYVAAAELLRLAATGRGLLLMVDDLHEADEASLRLLHYLSRCATTEPVLIAVAHRPDAGQAFEAVAASLVARGGGTHVELAPLSEAATRRLVANRFPDLPSEAVDRICALSDGRPFTVIELARNAGSGSPAAVLPALPATVLGTFERVALLGTTFITDELLAAAEVDEDEAYRHLAAGLEALLVEPAESGFRFRHALVREALVTRMGPERESSARRDVAERLVGLGAPPSRIAHQFLAAGRPSRAVPFVLRAVETAGALGAYRDALTLVDGVRHHTGPKDLPHLLARRGDLLMALGDPQAVSAYLEAAAVTTGTEQRLVRARLARAASFVGDLDTARAALEGLDQQGDAADAPILLARGNVAYFTGEHDVAWDVASQARDRLQTSDDPWQFVDLVALQGLIAHQRGEWFERFRMELRRTHGKQRLVTALFDAHLCVAEYLLYGPVPYAEVIADAEDLKRRAQQAGALRGVAFATALMGEAALLKGDLDRAERDLVESVDLHRAVDAPSGEAHSLQRLAEVRLRQGDRDEANRLLQQALPLARWSVVSLHLLQRVYGTMITAAPDVESAHAVVDMAEAALGENDRCTFCDVMLAVPASIACSDAGDLDGARRHLTVAKISGARWQGTAWTAAVAEAQAHLAFAEDRPDDARRLTERAAELFRVAGQPHDAHRCAEAASRPAGLLATP